MVMRIGRAHHADARPSTRQPPPRPCDCRSRRREIGFTGWQVAPTVPSRGTVRCSRAVVRPAMGMDDVGAGRCGARECPRGGREQGAEPVRAGGDAAVVGVDAPHHDVFGDARAGWPRARPFALAARRASVWVSDFEVGQSTTSICPHQRRHLGRRLLAVGPARRDLHEQDVVAERRRAAWRKA